MLANATFSIAEWVKALIPAFTGAGGVVAALALWTSRRSQHLQNNKAIIDTLQSAIEGVTDDPQYRKFLEDISKEKLASMAFGVPIRPGELGRLMAYYDQGFASIGEIRTAWTHRSDDDTPLSFRLHNFERTILGLGLGYALGCMTVGGFGFFLACLLPTAQAWHFAPYVAFYFVLAGAAYLVLRSHHIAESLYQRERTHRRLEEQSLNAGTLEAHKFSQ